MKVFLSCIFIFILSFFLRSYHIHSDDIQADEPLWNSRTEVFLKRIEEKKFKNATTHLGHPGIPSVVAMSIGEKLLTKIEKKFPFFLLNYNLDKFDHKRLGNAFFSSLIPLVLFLFAFKSLGTLPAFTGALLLALDPRHISVSRMVHIDSVLGLFALLSVYCFFYSLKNNNLKLKLLAGFFWGVALSAKPTVIAIAAALILFKLSLFALRRLNKLDQNIENFEINIRWSDVWSILIGHSFFNVIHTSFHIHPSPYIYRLGIKPKLADYVLQLSQNLAEYRTVILAIFIITALISIIKLNSTKNLKTKFALNLFLIFQFISIPIFFFTNIAQNSIRYWAWVLGLSKTPHISYGRVWESEKYGYLGIMYREFPEALLIGLILGIIILAKNLLTIKLKHKDLLGLISSLSFVIWLILLSSSSKQAIRYLIPILPFGYLVTAYWISNLHKSFKKIVVLVFLTLQFSSFSSANWKFNNYYNYISGGIQNAKKTLPRLYFAGEQEALEFLIKEQKNLNRAIKVAVTDDQRTIRVALKHFFPNEKIDFNAKPLEESADFLLSYGPSLKLLEQKYINGELTGLLPIFSSKIKDTEVINIYKFRTPEYKIPHISNLDKINKNTGKLIFLDQNKKEKLIELISPRDKKGFFMFGNWFKVSPGNYTLTLKLKATDKNKILEEFKDKASIKLEFSNCYKLIQIQDISEDEFLDFNLECKIKENKFTQASAYWFGRNNLLVKEVSFMQTN